MREAMAARRAAVSVGVMGVLNCAGSVAGASAMIAQALRAQATRAEARERRGRRMLWKWAVATPRVKRVCHSRVPLVCAILLLRAGGYIGEISADGTHCA